MRWSMIFFPGIAVLLVGHLLGGAGFNRWFLIVLSSIMMLWLTGLLRFAAFMVLLGVVRERARASSIVISVVGLVASVCVTTPLTVFFYCTLSPSYWPGWWPLPLWGITDFAAGPGGDVYIATRVHGRIHRYSKEGSYFGHYPLPDESSFCPGRHSHLGEPARQNLDLSPLRAGLLRARSPTDSRRTGNRKVGSLGNLMIGSLPGSACWIRDRALGRSRTSDGRPLPCHASSAPHERHWRLEGPKPFIIAQNSRLFRYRPLLFRRRCLLVAYSRNRCTARAQRSLVV